MTEHSLLWGEITFLASELSAGQTGRMDRRFPEQLPDISCVASALAHPTRAAMCAALMTGWAWTAGELAAYAGVAAPTCSKHLDALVASGVVQEVRQGRHRYIRLANDDVARAIEALGCIAHKDMTTAPSLNSSRLSRHARTGRTCYSHLAGELGVSLAQQFQQQGLVSAQWQMTQDGCEVFAGWGVCGSPSGLSCMDSTERQFHLAGELGKALCEALFTQRWLTRLGTSRAVILTPKGAEVLAAYDITIQPSWLGKTAS